MLLLSPLFSARNIPVPLRVLMAMFLAFVAAGSQQCPAGIAADAGPVVMLLVFEFVVGLFMGWAVRLTTHAIEIAGQIIASEIGFSMGQQLDPSSGESTNAVSSLLTAFGTVIFLVSGAHHAVLAAYLKSYSLAPVGMLNMSPESGTLLVHATGKIFLTAMQMAAPLIALNFVISLTFAILGKAAPAIQVFSESFAVRIVTGLMVLGLTVRLVAQLAFDRFQEAPELMLRLIR
jgi:flagellar biosynthetic protein FliR